MAEKFLDFHTVLTREAEPYHFEQIAAKSRKKMWVYEVPTKKKEVQEELFWSCAQSIFEVVAAVSQILCMVNKSNPLVVVQHTH